MRFLEGLKGIDWLLVLPLLVIQIFGAIAVYSSSKGQGMEVLFKKHLLYLGLSWAVILLLAREKFRNILDLSLYIYLFNLFLLTLVLVAGSEVYGAKRWLNLGFINVQPSEFMKLSLLLLSAYLMPLIKGLKDRKILLLLLSVAIPAVVTFKQPDLGTTVAYFVPLGAMVLALGIRMRYILAFTLLALISLPFLWSIMKDYQKKRILAVIDPYSDYLGSGYQLIQSVIAIGSGGLTGKGLTAGTQSHLMFLPETHTDFIFSVIGEELGFLGSMIFITAVGLFLFRILTYSRMVLRKSEILFVVGVFSLLLFQYGVNIGMSLGMFPVVGIPLPFVSFGGSSTLTFSLMVGLLLSLYREYREDRPMSKEEAFYE